MWPILASRRKRSSLPNDRLFCSIGVGHPEQPLSDMRGADATSWQYHRPAGVVFRFQVIEYSIEPSVPNRARHLFSKDCCRATLADEPHELGPQVALVGCPFAFPGARERLAWAGTGPNRPATVPSGEVEGDGPATDASEEMALVESIKVASVHIRNTPFVHVAGGYQALAYQFP